MRRALAVLTGPRAIGGLVCTFAVAAAAATIAARAGMFTANVREPPFFATFRPDLSWRFTAPAVAVLASAVSALLFLVRRPSVGAVPFMVGATGAALVARAGLNTARQGIFEWNWPLNPGSPEGHNEYGAAVHDLVEAGGVGPFLDRFAEEATYYPTHASGHPPGPVLLSYLLDRMGIGTPGDEAVVLILVGTLVVPLTYLAARVMLDEPSARIATVLAATAPTPLLLAVTSWDGLFAAAAMTAVVLLLGRGLAARAGGTLAAAATSFLSYALPLAVVVVALIHELRGERRRAIATAAAPIAATLAGLGLLAVLAGYDPIGALDATKTAYDRGIAHVRPYPYWFLGAPLAFTIGLGPVVAWGWLRRIATGDPIARALALAILAACVLGATKGEVERIWQFLVPFACLAAAPLLVDRRRLLVVGVTLAAVQAAAVELFYSTTF